MPCLKMSVARTAPIKRMTNAQIAARTAGDVAFMTPNVLWFA